MRLNEARISHISHLILDGIWADDLVDFKDEEMVLMEIKESIKEYLKIEDEIDEFVRKKIRSYSKKILEGSKEWEVLYKKFIEEELLKISYKYPIFIKNKKNI